MPLFSFFCNEACHLRDYARPQAACGFPFGIVLGRKRPAASPSGLCSAASGLRLPLRDCARPQAACAFPGSPRAMLRPMRLRLFFYAGKPARKLAFRQVFQHKKNAAQSAASGIALRSAERSGFEPEIPFWGIHAFQACLLSHSSISPDWAQI